MQGARRDAYETTSAGVAKTAANEPFQADWMFDGPSPDARRGGVLETISTSRARSAMGWNAEHCRAKGSFGALLR
jgi:hypothetical protein